MQTEVVSYTQKQNVKKGLVSEKMVPVWQSDLWV